MENAVPRQMLATITANIGYTYSQDGCGRCSALSTEFRLPWSFRYAYQTKAATISGITHATTMIVPTTERSTPLRPRISTASSSPRTFCPITPDATVNTTVRISDWRNVGSANIRVKFEKPVNVALLAPTPVSAALVNEA